MTDDIYRALQQQMDQYSVGFPQTQSGVEIRILKRLFLPEEAALYLDLSLFLEEAQSVAERTGRNTEKTAQQLAQMAQKGLIFRLRRNNVVRYAAVPFVVGSYEFQLGNMDKELAGMVEQYFEEAFVPSLGQTTLPMRTIPVNQAVSVTHPVAAHDDAVKILGSQKKIALANCICRTQQKLVDKGCGKPLEVCFVFGSHADYFVENGLARFVGLDEAIAALKGAQKAGLVTQPFNVTNPGGMCNCCGDCCGVLRSLKLLPEPARAVLTNYYAQCDSSLCSGCGLCSERCQMDAINFSDEDGTAIVDLNRCIGFGLCVTECPEDALSLLPVDSSRHRTPPVGVQELMLKIAKERGKNLMPLKIQEK
jgi:ferredoxin